MQRNSERWPIVVILGLLLLFIFWFGLKPGPSVPPELTPTPEPEFVAETFLREIREFREESTFVVTLKFLKKSLNPFEQPLNEQKAVYHDILVGQQMYDEWETGRVVSSQFDQFALLDEGIVTYDVIVSDKHVYTEYFWVSRANLVTPMSEARFRTAFDLVGAAGLERLTVPYAGVTHTYILDKPIGEYEFVATRPLIRYFIEIEVKNETLGADPLKYLRNATNTHVIEVEVTADVYDRVGQGDVWEPSPSIGSLYLSGRYSTLRGTVIRRWAVEDAAYLTATTGDGDEFIIPAK